MKRIEDIIKKHEEKLSTFKAEPFKYLGHSSYFSTHDFKIDTIYQDLLVLKTDSDRLKLLEFLLKKINQDLDKIEDSKKIIDEYNENKIDTISDMFPSLEDEASYNAVVSSIKTLKLLLTELKRLALNYNDDEVKSETLVSKQKIKASISYINKIAWNLNQTDLIEFFDLMSKNNLITESTYRNMNVVIRDCFTDKFGNSYDNQNISKTKYNKGKNSKNSYKLDQTIEEFRKRKPST